MRVGQDIPTSGEQSGCPGRAATGAPNTGREQNNVSPVAACIAFRTGSTLRRQVLTPILPPVGAFLSPSGDTPTATLAAGHLAVLYSQTRSPVLPRASVGNVSWMRIVPIAGPYDTAIAVEGRISLGRIELGGESAQDVAESLGSIASIIGSLRHVQQHARRRSHEAGKVSQGFGNV